MLYNRENQGYGANQKLGFHSALQQGFDFVALIHGDGQYAHGYTHYTLKLDYGSPRSLALQVVPPAVGFSISGAPADNWAVELKRRECLVTGVDMFPLRGGVELD